MRLARNLEQVGPRLPALDADRATERIVTAMSRMSDRGALETLTRGLEAVVPRLTASATVRAGEQLAASLARTRVAVAIRALASGLTPLRSGFPRRTSSTFSNAPRTGSSRPCSRSYKPDDLRCLAEGLGELGLLLTPAAAGARLAALGTARSPVELLRLAQALAALGPRLAASEGERVAERVLERLFEAVASAGQPDDLRPLAEAIKTVLPRMSSESAGRVTGRVIDIIAATGDGFGAEGTGRRLGERPGLP